MVTFWESGGYLWNRYYGGASAWELGLAEFYFLALMMVTKVFTLMTHQVIHLFCVVFCACFVFSIKRFVFSFSVLRTVQNMKIFRRYCAVYCFNIRILVHGFKES